MCRSARFPHLAGDVHPGSHRWPELWPWLLCRPLKFWADAAMEHRDFPRWPTKKRAWHDFFDTEKDEFSIARDSSGFIIAQKEAQLMWRFDAVLYQSAVCIAAFKESSWQVSRIYPSCYGHFRPQGSNWDMSPLELVSRFLTRFPSSLICFCRCVMVGSISLPIHHFAKWGQWEPSPP